MKDSYKRILEGNKNWSEKKLKEDPDYFKGLTLGQNPEYLWIGCSDSRVPPELIEPYQLIPHLLL